MRSRRRAITRHWRLVAISLLIGLVVGGELVLAYDTTTNDQATNDGVERTLNIINLAVEARSALVDMQSGYRGYVLTGQEAFLQPYTAGRDTYQADLHQLEQMTARNAAQVSRWQNIERLAADWQQQVAEPTIARRRLLAAQPGAADEMAASITSEVGNDRIQAVRTIFADALSVEQATLVARQQEQAASDARLRVVLVWGTVGAAALAAVLGSWIFHTLERERLAGVRLAIQTAEHELYNRLAAASGNVQMLERDSDLNSRQQAWATRARSSIDAAVGVIRRMRDLPVLGETVWSEARVITIDFAR